MFKDVFIELEECDPFQYNTIASTCQNIYFSNHMPDKSISINKNCNLPEDGPYSINILNQVAHYIRNNIIVINGNYFNSVSYETGKNYDKNLYLLHIDNHYDLITSLTAFYGAPYYCDKCHTPYRNKNNHKCNNDKSFVDKLNRIKKLKSELMEYNIIYENGKMICKNCKI